MDVLYHLTLTFFFCIITKGMLSLYVSCILVSLHSLLCMDTGHRAGNALSLRLLYSCIPPSLHSLLCMDIGHRAGIALSLRLLYSCIPPFSAVYGHWTPGRECSLSPSPVFLYPSLLCCVWTLDTGRAGNGNQAAFILESEREREV